MDPSSSDIPPGLRRVPPFPPIAVRLLALLSTQPVEISEVVDLISSDPTFTAILLQRVNSVEFGLVYPVSSVQQAVTLLGFDRTREITLLRATAAYSRTSLRTAELRRCWEHTIATAVLSEWIAVSCGAFVNVAFTAGIIHDIGRLGLLVAYPNEYEQIICNAAERCLDLLDFEREQFGVHHAEAGRMLAERWGLPEELRVIAGRHHDPCEGRELDLLRIVHVACRLADVLGYDITRPLRTVEAGTVLEELPETCRRRLNLAPEKLRAEVDRRLLESGACDSDSSQTCDPPLDDESQAMLDELTPDVACMDARSRSASRASRTPLVWAVALLCLVFVVLLLSVR
jgi:putative nucleotidyltransferase with HDIG domain